MSAGQRPEWVPPETAWRIPEGGLTAADLDHWPELPPHTELIDGGLFFMSPQRGFHTEMLFVLQSGLRAGAPPNLYVTRQMSVVLDDRHRLEPDILVIDAKFRGDGQETWYPAEAVLLAIEVVSPESQERDRRVKPRLYAKAGIQHFWRIEENNGRPVVCVFELDPGTSSYTPAGIFHDRVALTQPFVMDFDFTGLDQP